MANPTAKAIEHTENTKLTGGKGTKNNSKMSTTYASQGSCPHSCPFRGTRACYGIHGPLGIQWMKLNNKTTNTVQIAKDESRAIDNLTGKNPLRVHTVGDCANNVAAKIVSAACERHTAKYNQPAYTYTHAWRVVDRASWGKVSVLASCETPKAILEARKRGYAAAIVVQKFKRNSVYLYGGTRVIPCPKQTGKTESCQTCKLCMNADRLHKTRYSIAFHIHGPTVRAKALLEKMGK